MRDELEVLLRVLQLALLRDVRRRGGVGHPGRREPARAAPPLLLEPAPPRMRVELDAAEPRRAPEERAPRRRAGARLARARTRVERHAEDGVVQVREAPRERLVQALRPAREVARLDVVHLDRVVGEAEDEGAGLRDVEREGVDEMRERWEDAVVLDCC